MAEIKMKMIQNRTPKPINVVIDEQPIQIPGGRSKWAETTVNKMLMSVIHTQIIVLSDADMAKIEKEAKDAIEAKAKAEADKKKADAAKAKEIMEALAKKKLMDAEIAKKKKLDDATAEIEVIKKEIEARKEMLKTLQAEVKKLSEKSPEPE